MAATPLFTLIDLSLDNVGRETSRVGVAAVQSAVDDIRDRIQGRRKGADGANRPLGYAWSPDDDPFLSAYAKAVSPNPLAKAPPVQDASSIQYAVWGQAYGDRERRRGDFLGLDIGRSATTFGGLMGADVVISRLRSPSDAFVLGILGGDMQSLVQTDDGSTTRVRGPTIGLYSMYIYGGLSVDSSFKVDFLHLDRASPGLPDMPLAMTNYSGTLNLNNKYDFESWWMEPTAGISYTRSIWDETSRMIGFNNGVQVRLQSGLRFGTSWTTNGIQIDPSLTAMLYDDVIIAGGTLATAGGLVGPTDQGKLFGQLVGKLNFAWTNNFSSYVEAEVRGRDAVLGSAARFGFRYSFQ
jgi:hypothetical protein